MTKEIRKACETYDAYLEALGHVLYRDDDGDVDHWRMDWDYHNGPGCMNCDETWCQHCEDDVKPCPGREATDAADKAARYKQYLKLKEEFDV